MPNVKRGVLMYKGEDNNFHPFLVRAREQDIIWDKFGDNSDVNNALSGFTGDVSESRPTTLIVLEKNGWRCEIEKNTAYCTFKKRIYISSNFSLDTTQTTLTNSVSLPFAIKGDGSETFNAVNSATNTTLQHSFLSLIPNITDGNISTFKISYYKPKTIEVSTTDNDVVGSLYSDMLKDGSNYTDSFAYVTVCGYLKV